MVGESAHKSAVQKDLVMKAFEGLGCISDVVADDVVKVADLCDALATDQMMDDDVRQALSPLARVCRYCSSELVALEEALEVVERKHFVLKVFFRGVFGAHVLKQATSRRLQLTMTREASAELDKVELPVVDSAAIDAAASQLCREQSSFSIPSAAKWRALRSGIAKALSTGGDTFAISQKHRLDSLATLQAQAFDAVNSAVIKFFRDYTDQVGKVAVEAIKALDAKALLPLVNDFDEKAAKIPTVSSLGVSILSPDAEKLTGLQKDLAAVDILWQRVKATLVFMMSHFDDAENAAMSEETNTWLCTPLEFTATELVGLRDFARKAVWPKVLPLVRSIVEAKAGQLMRTMISAEGSIDIGKAVETLFVKDSQTWDPEECHADANTLLAASAGVFAEKLDAVRMPDSDTFYDSSTPRCDIDDRTYEVIPLALVALAMPALKFATEKLGKFDGGIGDLVFTKLVAEQKRLADVEEMAATTATRFNLCSKSVGRTINMFQIFKETTHILEQKLEAWFALGFEAWEEALVEAEVFSEKCEALVSLEKDIDNEPLTKARAKKLFLLVNTPDENLAGFGPAAKRAKESSTAVLMMRERLTIGADGTDHEEKTAAKMIRMSKVARLSNNIVVICGLWRGLKHNETRVGIGRALLTFLANEAVNENLKDLVKSAADGRGNFIVVDRPQ